MSLTTKTLVVPAYDLPRGRAVEVAEVAAEALQAAQAAQAPEGSELAHNPVRLNLSSSAHPRRGAADRGEYCQAA